MSSAALGSQIVLIALAAAVLTLLIDGGSRRYTIPAGAGHQHTGVRQPCTFTGAPSDAGDRTEHPDRDADCGRGPSRQSCAESIRCSTAASYGGRHMALAAPAVAGGCNGSGTAVVLAG
jgi:hypothetical protein